MPSFLTPGVYIQEVALGPSPIQGVSTSVAGFVGEAQRGLVNGPPQLVTSFADFQRQYGGFVAGKALAYAVQGFFDNGGQQAFIARVADATASQAAVVPQLGYDVAILGFSAPKVVSGNPFTIRAASVVGLAEATGNPATATQIDLITKTGSVFTTLTVQGVNVAASSVTVVAPIDLSGLGPSAYALRYALPAPQTAPAFTFSARDPGSFGNGLSVLLTPTYLATATIQGVKIPYVNPTPPPTHQAPAYFVSTVAPFEAGMQVELANAPAPPALSGRDIQTITSVDASKNIIYLGGGTASFAVGDFVRALGWTLQVYYNGALVETLTGITSNAGGSDGLSSINTNSQWVRISALTSPPTVTYPSLSVINLSNSPVPPPPSPAVVTGTVNIADPTLYPPPPPGPLDGLTLTLSLNGSPTDLLVTFSAPATVLDVLAQINAVTSPGVVAATPADFLQLTTQLIGPGASLAVTGGTALSLLGLIAGATATGGGTLSSCVLFPGGDPIPLAGGTDGTTTATDVIGSDSPPRSGLKALEATEGISIIAAPGWVSGATSTSAGDSDDVVVELIGQAERKQDRFAVFGVVDYSTNANVDVNAILAERGKWNSQYAAMYVPYVMMLDPLTNTNIPVDASGHVVGAYANTDNLRGVFKSPANVVLQNIVGFSRDIPTGEQDLLNPAGVNVIRNFPGLGNVIWGARTIAADPLWKYVSVRRLFIFIEQSLVQGTRYAVFEPNDLNLWARLRDSVSNFLTTQWRSGALFGATAKQSFFVRVDETTTTQDDRDNGIVNILVGIAPVKPAEFIVFQIGQAPQSVIIAEQGS